MVESEASGDAWVDDPADPEHHGFDAFNSTTWTFTPAPTPWHRTRQAVVAMLAVSVAVIALVVSVVLLTVHGPASEENPPATEITSTPSTVTTPQTTRAVPPPLPPPPPPPPTASRLERAPVIVRPSRTSKKPEINVTRTPRPASPTSSGR